MGLNSKLPPKQTEQQEYAQHLQVGQADAKYEVQKTGQPDVAGSEALPGAFETNGMSLTVGGGRTTNLGDYNSAKVSVSVTVPCAPQNLEQAYAWGLGWVAAKIEQLMG